MDEPIEDAVFYTELFKILTNSGEAQTVKISQNDKDFLAEIAEYWNSLEPNSREEVA